MTPGFSADLIVLDRDITACDPYAIAETEVFLTLFDGHEVHRHARFDARMKFLTANTPALPLPRIAAGLATDYGLSGRLSPLYSERDQTLLLRTDTGAGLGAGFVVKIVNAAEDAAQIDCQLAVLQHIARTDPDLGVPRVRLSGSGQTRSMIDTHLIYVLSFLEGRVPGHTPLPPRTLTLIGTLQARLAKAMRGFFHPAAGTRALLWDSRLIAGLVPHLSLLPAPHRAQARTAIEHFLAHTLPDLPKLRAQILHADLHGHNLVLSPDGSPAGVIDFGDMLHGPLILDLANAISDFSTPDSFAEVATHVLQGYHAATPLDADEIAPLYDLILMRLIATALIIAYRRHATPDAPDYMAEGFGQLPLLTALLDLGRDAATDLFRQSCGQSCGLAPLHREPRSIAALLARRKRVMGSNPYLFYDPPLHIIRGEGVWLTDATGRRYLDFYNNVPILGHCHPGVTAAIAAQSRILNTNTRYLGDQVLTYAERLGALTHGQLTACAFVNSGSEANDIAWRMARAWTGAQGFLCQDFAYHGITEAIDAVSPSASKSGVLAPHVRTIMAPDRYHHPQHSAATFAADADRAIAALAECGLKPAAVIIDAAFMTNGILEPLPGYLAQVFAKVRAAGGLCIADEVQSGFGRMGTHFWGYQHHGVTPDFVTIGKPAGNGHPIGVVLTRPEILDHFVATSAFFSTFGGNNVACAAGLAVLDAIDTEDLVRHASTTGAHFKAGLTALMRRHAIIGDVRVSGLAAGVELVTDRATRAPAKAETERLINHLKDQGVLAGSEGINGNVIKMRPPLAVTIPDIDFALAALDRALSLL